jgi:hypothetical protein
MQRIYLSCLPQTACLALTGTVDHAFITLAAITILPSLTF